jgi:hypothetical protein
MDRESSESGGYKGTSMMFENRTWFLPAIAPVDMPIGLNHLDSDFCWCDPTVELDENDTEVVRHRRVTWN